jgi:hypothetical protein
MECLFRAWDPYDETMYYSNWDADSEYCQFFIEKSSVIAYVSRATDYTPVEHPALPERLEDVMIASPFKDKIGDTIYAKDIIKVPRYLPESEGNPYDICVVEYENGCFIVKYDDSEDGDIELLCDIYEVCEVIGNVFANKDLIK